MKLKEFKEYITDLPEGSKFSCGISKPFSWRGSYDEVAFAFDEKSSTREQILENISLAYTETFEGYKGGSYTYNDYTKVNFEETTAHYSDGGYCALIIAKLTNSEPYLSQEERLVKLAFT